MDVCIELTGEEVLRGISELDKILLTTLGEWLPLSCLIEGRVSSCLATVVGGADEGELGGDREDSKCVFPLERSYMGSKVVVAGGL